MSALMARIAADLAKMGKNIKPAMSKAWYYARVELTPPSPRDIIEIKNGFTGLIKAGTSGAWKNLTVKEAFRNTVVATEVLMWFYIGECIGKGSLIGYQV